MTDRLFNIVITLCKNIHDQSGLTGKNYVQDLLAKCLESENIRKEIEKQVRERKHG
jgi:hypothetical protein